MILTIDVGNSRVKAAVFEQSTLNEKYVFEGNNAKENLNKILESYNSIQNIIVSNVGSPEINAFLDANWAEKTTYISTKTVFPFDNLYATPKTQGIDRLVLASGAVIMFPNQNRLVIDAGTCVTYDYINAENQYLGGAISPGLSLRYKSLNDYTTKLPLLKTTEPEANIGNSTTQCIHSGIVNGLVFEIKGFIDEFEAQNSNFIIILTGGDAIFLAKRLKNTIFANSNFLLESLNLIHIYNSQND